ncbi:MAG TPA: GFA family protein [Dongiaceae bacterium]|nr:GFA family protein [Dongiaceae bacterium]
MQGGCLCGLTRFSVGISRIKAYQCHCSLCRLQSGTASNLGTIVDIKQFEWLSGRDHIQRWVKDSGFTSDFCSHCGSPVPNELRSLPYYWVPVGTLDDAESVDIIAHLCIRSKASWDSIAAGVAQYDELPDFNDLIAKLNPA